MNTSAVMRLFREHVREIVYGGIDGIITTFAIVSSFSGAVLTNGATLALSTGMVLLFGFANLFADGVSMGLGGFLSLRAEKRMYAENRRQVLAAARERHIREMTEILAGRGFSAEDARALIALLMKNEKYWIRFSMQEKFGLLPTGDTEITKKSFAIFAAFVLFGAIPIIPFMFPLLSGTAFLFSAGGVMVALVALGIVRALITREKIPRSVAEVLLIGTAAGAVAFSVGFLFRGVL